MLKGHSKAAQWSVEVSEGLRTRSRHTCPTGIHSNLDWNYLVNFKIKLPVQVWTSGSWWCRAPSQPAEPTWRQWPRPLTPKETLVSFLMSLRPNWSNICPRWFKASNLQVLRGFLVLMVFGLKILWDHPDHIRSPQAFIFYKNLQQAGNWSAAFWYEVCSSQDKLSTSKKTKSNSESIWSLVQLILLLVLLLICSIDHLHAFTLE